jgi:putative endonuclease
LRSKKDGKLYTGCTGNLKNRLVEHTDGAVRSTRYRLPLELIYYEASRNKIDAMRRNKYLKTTYGKRYLKFRLKSDLVLAISQG